MSFTSFDFIIFLAMSIITYYALPVRFQKYVLLISSIVFYCSFGMKSILILLISVVVIYLSAIGIERTTYEKTRYYIVYRRGILIAAIICSQFSGKMEPFSSYRDIFLYIVYYRIFD